jgi:hypothetical protein
MDEADQSKRPALITIERGRRLALIFKTHGNLISREILKNDQKYCF